MKWKATQTTNRVFDGTAQKAPTYEAVIHLEPDNPESVVTLKDLQDFLQTVIASGVPTSAALGSTFDMALRWS